jgi:hypothetical protein
MRVYVLAATAAACLGSAAAAADKFTATCSCDKPDPQHLLPVGDRPDHSLGVEARKCTWTQPIEIGGDASKDGVATNTVEVSGNKARFRGVHEVTFASGDKLALPYQGTGLLKDKKSDSSKGTFTFAEGTGKLKGVKGTGTFSCKSAGDTLSCDVTGEYELAK